MLTYIVASTIVLLLTVEAQLDITWEPCTQYTYPYSYQTNTTLGPTNAQCGTTSVKYIHNSDNTFNISYAIKRYPAIGPSLGSIVVIGDAVVGNSGNAIEQVGYALFAALNRQYNIILPTFRGTGERAFPCSLALASFDKMSGVNCQNATGPYGTDYSGFTVDAIATDTLLLVQTIKNTSNNRTLFALGRGFGSYVLHRMLQIDGSQIDAVIMDGVCAGRFCNASDWDVQRNAMTTNLLTTLWKSFNASYTYTNFTTTRADPITVHGGVLKAAEIQAPICGRTIYQIWEDIFEETFTYSIFDQTIRPKALASLFYLYRCSGNDFGNGVAWFFDLFGADRSRSIKYYYRYIASPVASDSTFVATHIILSELMDLKVRLDDSKLQFSSLLQIYADNLINKSWKRYTPGVNFGGMATYTKPMLLLNGDFDPQAPLNNTKSFAWFFPQAQLVIMPGMSSNSIMKSYMKNANGTCGLNLVSQFIRCPTCTLDVSCVSDMVGLTLDGDRQTTQLYGNPFEGYYIPPTPLYTGRAILSGITIPLPILIVFGLFMFRKSRRVKSRIYGPYLGLAYAFEHLLYNTIKYGGEWVAFPLLDIAIIVQEVLLVSCCTVFSLQAIRFFILSVLYSNMLHSVPNTRALKLIASRVLSTFVVSFVAAMWLVYGIIVTILQPQLGYEDTQEHYIFASVAVAAILGINSILFWMYDMYTHAMKKKCNMLDYWVTSDPLLFRIDSMLVIPIVACGVISAAVPNIYVDLVFDELAILFMCMFFGGNLVIACLLDKYRKTHREMRATEEAIDELGELKQLLESEIGEQYLKKYCAREFSLENVIAYKALKCITEFYDNYEMEHFYQALTVYYDQFLKQGAEAELNIPAALHGRITQLLIRDGSLSQTEEKQILEDFSDALMGNLLDTFSRFKFTPEYEESVQAMAVDLHIKDQIS